MEELISHGRVTRNWALGNFISRLGAIILVLKNEGMAIEGKYIKSGQGTDFVYSIEKPQESNTAITHLRERRCKDCGGIAVYDEFFCTEHL